MKIAIMQPYFMPYIGYFQLIAAVDQFIVYDNIKYTKKGWINRNRLLLNGKDVIFSLPLKKDSDTLKVVNRELAGDFKRAKLLNQFKGAYSRAPQFKLVYPVLERIVGHEDNNLFNYIHHSIVQMCEYLDIKTEIRVSSQFNIDHELIGQHKVLALCNAAGANTYVNSIGGVELYDKREFWSHGIDLQFIIARPFQYQQFEHEFVQRLSIVDVLMFNPLNVILACLNESYEVI